MGPKTSNASTKSHQQCQHERLVYDTSSYAADVGYQRPTRLQRAKARGQKTGDAPDLEQLTFPGPLGLPDDDLTWDPKWPAQSLLSWTREKERNKVTADQKTIYIVAPPTYAPNVDYVRSWAALQSPVQRPGQKVAEPKTQDVADYIAAFYHPLPVRMMPSMFTFARLEPDGASHPDETDRSKLIGINFGDEQVAVRMRPSPDGTFKGQLNLDDLIDAVIYALPDDAYSMVLLVHHDIYENEEDDFACGRAYGGSRAGVISTARYHPALDGAEHIDNEHEWPSSHCSRYMDSLLARRSKKVKTDVRDHPEDRALLQNSGGQTSVFPIRAASDALQGLAPDVEALTGRWLARVCRTTSHELGHCFGMDHCVYYACVMQGTCSLAEDNRQPPYLCPIDLVKVLRATGATPAEHYRALAAFCNRHPRIRLFKALAAWIRSRMVQLDLEAPRVDVEMIDLT